MKWGFNWNQGPFELLDSIDPIKFADTLKARGGDVEGMLKVLVDSGNTSFYRNDGSEFIGTDGQYHSVS